MPRVHYYNPLARVGDVFGIFADRDKAIEMCRRAMRDLNTHTIYRTAAGFVVTCRGY
jgi:hypothetical protein